MIEDKWESHGFKVAIKPPSFGNVIKYQRRAAEIDSTGEHVETIFKLFNAVLKDSKGKIVKLEDIPYIAAYNIAQEAMERLHPKDSTSGELTEPT